MVKLSVLIPIYNVKEYLPECLNSVISQTLTDIEIICINDGSTDDSGVILSNYAHKDTRIKIINQENSGYGHSMNVGLEAATGEYIGIVESDDLVEPEFFEDLYNRAKENDLDIVKSECKFAWPSQNYCYNYHVDYLEKYFNQVIPIERLWLRCLFFMNIWAGIYRRDFIEKNEICFNETPGASYQDNGFWMQSMIFADRVMFTEENGYMYRQDNCFSSVKDSKKVYAMSDEYEWLAGHLQDRITAAQMNVVNAFRLTRGYWNYFRIDDTRKREFCNRLISDFNKYGDVFAVDLTWQKLFYQIKNDPDSFCQRTIDAKRDIKERIEKAKSIIIYGAGNRGQRLFRLFCDYGFVEKLQCFVETASHKNNTIGTALVRQISDKDIDWTGALVVISAADKSKMAGDMREKCKELAVTDVIGSDGFFDNYYMLT